MKISHFENSCLFVCLGSYYTHSQKCFIVWCTMIIVHTGKKGYYTMLAHPAVSEETPGNLIKTRRRGLIMRKNSYLLSQPLPPPRQSFLPHLSPAPHLPHHHCLHTPPPSHMCRIVHVPINHHLVMHPLLNQPIL